MVLSFFQAYERTVTQATHVRTAARRLVALITVGYAKLDGEQDVLPFNLPPSSRTAASQSSSTPARPSFPLSPASFNSPTSGRVPLSLALSMQPSLPETHSHTIGNLPSTPSIARIRGHARNHCHSAAAHCLPHNSSGGGSSRISTASTVRNLDAVQLVRDVFLQCPSSSLRLHLLSNLEWVFTSAAQLHVISSTNFTSRLLQSLQSFSIPVQNALLQSLQLIITHTHTDASAPLYIPFKELCALNVTLTSDLTRASLPSILSVSSSHWTPCWTTTSCAISISCVRRGVLDVMVTNINLYYTQFAVAYETRYDPISHTHQGMGANGDGNGSGSQTPSSPFSPKASALSTLREEVKRKRQGLTPSGSPHSSVRRGGWGWRKRGTADTELASPQASSASSSIPLLHSDSLFLLPLCHPPRPSGHSRLGRPDYPPT